MRPSYIISIYLTDKSYGGPEEGGWWYTYGKHIKTIKVLPTEELADRYAGRVQHWLDLTINKGRRGIGSVLSEGMYTAEVNEGFAPRCYPAVKPFYE